MLQKKQKKFPWEKVLVITRSKYHLIFRVIFPWIMLGILYIALYWLVWKTEWTQYLRYPLIIMGSVFFWFQIMHKLFKYLYDFTIIDPLGVTTHKQKGIMRSYLKQIPANRVRSIQVTQNRFLENICWYGDIDIHTDFPQNPHFGEDTESPSLIGLTYVDHPHKVKTKLTAICFK